MWCEREERDGKPSRCGVPPTAVLVPNLHQRPRHARRRGAQARPPRRRRREEALREAHMLTSSFLSLPTLSEPKVPLLANPSASLDAESLLESPELQA